MGQLNTNQQGFSEEKKVKNIKNHTVISIIINSIGVLIAITGSPLCYLMTLFGMMGVKEGIKYYKKPAYASMILAMITLLVSIFTILLKLIQ